MRSIFAVALLLPGLGLRVAELGAPLLIWAVTAPLGEASRYGRVTVAVTVATAPYGMLTEGDTMAVREALTRLI